MTTRTRTRTATSRRVIAIAIGVSTVGLLSIGSAGATNYPASSSPVNTFQISGAGGGTLRAGQYAVCINQDVKKTGLTAVNDLSGSIAGFTTDVAHWSLDVTEKKTGTFKITGSLTAQPSVELQGSPKDGNFGKTSRDQFFAKSGTVTIETTTGSINASLTSSAGKTIKLAGSWRCKS